MEFRYTNHAYYSINDTESSVIKFEVFEFVEELDLWPRWVTLKLPIHYFKRSAVWDTLHMRY
jgi:hypothetical protein